MSRKRSPVGEIGAQASAWKAMERASDNFGLCDPATGIHFVTGKKASASSKSRWPNEFKESLGETSTQYQSRRSQQAKDREAKKRAARGDTCARGRAITPETAITSGERTYPCAVCFRAWQERINDNRRRVYALMAAVAA